MPLVDLREVAAGAAVAPGARQRVWAANGASAGATPAKRRPVVLVVLKGLAMGGAERVVLAQARAWDRERFEYHLTYLVPRLDLLVPEFEALGVEVHRPEGRSLLRNVFGGGFWRLLRRIRPDVVHAHLPVPGILARVLTEPRTAVVYSEHSMPASHRSLTRFVNRATYGWNDLVVCVSVAVYEAVKAYPRRDMITVPNAVGTPVVALPAADVRESLGVAPGEKLVVHVGNLRRVKGQENLVRALARLLEHRRDVKVVSAGSEDQAGERERLERLAYDLGVAEHLDFLGLRNDVADLMNAADLVVNPSDSEGLPLAVLEAMLLGKPVIATAVGGLPDLIADGVSGLLVPPRDPDALAAAMDGLLSNGERAAALGRAAREVATRTYSLEATVRTLEDAYAALAERVALP